MGKVIGLGVVWIGYSLLYYGISQLGGGNWGLLDVTVPSRWNNETASIKRDQ